MDTSTAIGALGALAQDTRLDTFRRLVRAGSAGLPAGAIAEALGARQNTLSSHLNILVNSGLVKRVREGRSIRYRADYDQTRALLAFLLEDCCRGDTAVCAPLLDAIAC
jgi:DNA-binding transcriptional ArsR family regulator